MRLVDLPDPEFLLPDWVVTRPRLTGVCGSDAKQVFMDWVNVATPDNPMKGFSLPQVLGHEVVAEVVALGPKPKGSTSAIGSCSTRGCRAGAASIRSARVRGRRPQPVLELRRRPDRPASHGHIE